MKKIILALAVIATVIVGCKKENTSPSVSTKLVELKLIGGNGGDWFWNTNGDISYINEKERKIGVVLDQYEFVRISGVFDQIIGDDGVPAYTWFYKTERKTHSSLQRGWDVSDH